MDEMFLLQAIPQTDHEQPKIEDPVGQRVYFGTNTKLSLSRKFQVFIYFFGVFKLLLLKNYSSAINSFTGRILLWHGYIQLSI